MIVWRRWTSVSGVASQSFARTSTSSARGMSAQGLDRGAADHRLGVVERVQDGRAVGLVPRRRLAEEPHRVDAEEAVADGRGGPDLIGPDGAEAEEGPEGMGPGRRREPRERLAERGDRRRADPVAELVAGPHPDAEVRVIERGDQRLRVGLAEVGRRVERGGFPGVAVVDDPPDPAAELVALGMVERDLDVADDLVVEVGDVERRRRGRPACRRGGTTGRRRR